MIYLEYWNGRWWVECKGSFGNEAAAWASLGGDDYNYRTVTEDGIVLTSKRVKK